MKVSCACCCGEMQELTKNEKYVFLRCPSCGFWTSRMTDGTFPRYEYLDAPVADGDVMHEWDSLV